MFAVLVTLIQKAGGEIETMEYLVAGKIRTISVFAWMADNETELDDRIVNLFLNGIIIGPTDCKCTDDHHVTKAGLTALWIYCRREVMPVPNPILNIGGAVPAPVTVGNNPSIVSSKPHTCLGTGVWAAQILKYENKNPGRKVPSMLLVGAEEYLPGSSLSSRPPSCSHRFGSAKSSCAAPSQPLGK